METGRKVQQRTIESKKKLLDSAYGLFAEKGYYNTNTKEIVRCAGISIGNFYNYYQNKGDIYCALLEDYCSSSCKAMQDLLDHLIRFDNRDFCREFLMAYLKQLLERFDSTDKFFEDSVVIAKENTRVQSILSKTEERLIAMTELFLTQRYPDKQEDFYIRARMIYMITDRLAKDILCVGTEQQKENYICLFADEIIRYAFDLQVPGAEFQVVC
ncbi:TetR/AcrR family transcriptional regulator [Hungatella sp. L12]|uniref:TetR/AcrR family transcriptional regulator n=1 Tax=Hungatella hominis TaxID=2763050 RepID=A0ABR7H6V7_9FIRM|nr:TetR/AcrR family transcriptional regulator [Hungatella hominis]MBC5708914.1 TetR/AcrR family transcriptional regulator [Hungatella hominis]